LIRKDVALLKAALRAQVEDRRGNHG
jgi:hypothetical protein